MIMIEEIVMKWCRNNEVDNEAILWLNGKPIEEKLHHKILWQRATKYHSDYVKHRYDLVKEQKNNPIEFL